MQLAARLDGVSVEDYLASEEGSEVKHEYVSGALYAMAGATKEHNQIAGNIYAAVRSALRGGPCRAFFADVKVRLKIMDEDVFYYPDVLVGCDPRDTHAHYLVFPKVIFEVLSTATEKLDRREKKWNYRTIETLEEYVLVAQDRIEVTAFRRASGWQPEVVSKLGQEIEIKSLRLSLPVSAIYEEVGWVASVE
jgi:Uma2 family endonuclease